MTDDFADALRKSGITVITCMNCATRQLGIEGEVFSMQLLDPDRVASFNVFKLRALISARDPAHIPFTQPRIFAPGSAEYVWLAWWLSHKAQPNWQHVSHIPRDLLSEPGIVVWVYSTEYSPDPQPYPILVDGTHRALHALSTGRPFQVYDALDSERDQVLSYSPGIDRELWPDAPRGRSHAS